MATSARSRPGSAASTAVRLERGDEDAAGAAAVGVAPRGGQAWTPWLAGSGAVGQQDPVQPEDELARFAGGRHAKVGARRAVRRHDGSGYGPAAAGHRVGGDGGVWRVADALSLRLHVPLDAGDKL